MKIILSKQQHCKKSGLTKRSKKQNYSCFHGKIHNLHNHKKASRLSSTNDAHASLHLCNIHERHGSFGLYSFPIGVTRVPPVSKSSAPRPKVLTRETKVLTTARCTGNRRSCTREYTPARAPVSLVGNGGSASSVKS